MQLGALILAIGLAGAAAPWREPPRDADAFVVPPSVPGHGRLRALGRGQAVVSNALGSFVVSRTEGLVGRLPPVEKPWSGMGERHAYALVDGHLLRAAVGDTAARDTGVRADRVDVMPGRIVAANGTRVTVYSDPGLTPLGAIDAPVDAAIFATTDGLAAVDLGDAIQLYRAGRWKRIARPEGRFVRIGAQLRVTRGDPYDSAKALDRTATVWVDVPRVDRAWDWGDAASLTRDAPRPWAPARLRDATQPAAPEPPPPPPPPIVLRGGVVQKSVLIQLIGTSGNTSSEDAVEDIIGDEASFGFPGAAPVYRVEMPALAEPTGSLDLLLLGDGLHDGTRWTRLPHALLVDRLTGATTRLSLPEGCDPRGTFAVDRLALLRCATGTAETLYAWDGSWRAEGTVGPLHERATLQVAEDGTLVLLPDERLPRGPPDHTRPPNPDPYATAWVRAPLAAGAATWSTLRFPGAHAWRPVPGGRALAVTARDGTLAIYDPSKPDPLYRIPIVSGLYHVDPTATDVAVWGTAWNLYDGLARTTFPLPP